MTIAHVADAVFGPSGERLGDTVLVDEGRIAAIGNQLATADMETVSHPGHQILPPLIDCHLHPLGYSSLITGISLMTAVSIDEILDRLAAADTGGPIVAQRLDDTRVGRLPNRHDFDRVSENAPIIAYRYCGHVAVVNTPALRLAGIDDSTPDPPGGSIDRDRTGQPTGVLRETAIELIGAAVGPRVPDPDRDATLAALDGLVGVGLHRIVGIVAAGEPLWCGVGVELDTLCSIATDLPIDIDVLVIASTPEELRSARSAVDRAGGRLRFQGWKGFADGSFGGHTAAMWEGFADLPDERGTLRLDPHHAGVMVSEALNLGGVAAIHAIGDRAIDATLDVFDQALADGADPDRLRVEHVSVPSDDAISRMASTGVIASIQPSFLESEADWVPERLGSHRPAYRFRSMHNAGVRMIGGSDCPVERPDPLMGIRAAIQRPGWNDTEHLDPSQALELFAGSAERHLDQPSSMSAGAAASFTLVRGQIDVGSAEVAGVMIDGRWHRPGPVAWPG